MRRGGRPHPRGSRGRNVTRVPADELRGEAGARSLGICETTETIRRRLTCRGIVQGVGFRPSVHRLATRLRLGGWVQNSPEGVIIEIEGSPSAVVQFVDELPYELPPLAKLEHLAIREVESCDETVFAVKASHGADGARGSLPPDSALCAECRADMEAEENRRHHYPFTTCSNCGPRFSIVEQLPYDRERTSMACFPLCPDCEREYRDPSDRRFHAEPLSCPVCGPRLQLVDSEGRTLAEAAEVVAQARRALADGAIVALKGLGGFQLACRADRAEPMIRLRERKRRPRKPFALMVRDLAAARRIVHLRPQEEASLGAADAPILLCARVDSPAIADVAAPDLDDLGVMLPTTPLHVELFRDGEYDVLVMTSGNRSDEPIACGNREALRRLAGVADMMLLHDRDVVRRLDDSVARTEADGGVPFVVRRSRGWVPRPLPLPVVTDAPVLALGAHLQTTACLALENQAIPSQHVGDLDNDDARGFLREAAAGLEQLCRTSAAGVAVDAHPDYASTWLGEELAAARDIPLLRLQHHLAHAAAVWAEHGSFPGRGEQAGAIILDGTGYGPDGTAWGGEWLLVDGELQGKRMAHLEPFPLVGGETAVREPWRVAVALLMQAEGAERLTELPFAQKLPATELESVRRLAIHEGWPRACGAGRLFEAAGALIAQATHNSYEGEAAARLEAAAAKCLPIEPWGEVQLPGAQLLAAAARRLIAGESPARVARGFHDTFCQLATELTLAAFGREVKTVALGGGCFVNRLLRSGLRRRLTQVGYDVLLPREVPPGDGGISYGQAVLAAVARHRNAIPHVE
jgi:hydrogenase maturation protein HypF